MSIKHATTTTTKTTMATMATVATMAVTVAVMALLGAACAPSLPAAGRGGLGLAQADGQALTPQAKCRVAASQSSPLVTEWPASEKANLEVLLRSGAVAVAYSGCAMRVLPHCRLRGSYRWQRTTPATDALEINDEDELYARLPLGAASLEGELKRSGKLSMQTIVSGQLKLEDGGSLARVAGDDASCAQATHLVSALSVGAFTLHSGDSASRRAGASLTALGQAGGGASRSASLMRGAGDPAECGAGTDQAPHPNCASPIQVFLLPIPGRVADEGPPGTVKVDFVSGNPASRWDVYADDEVICTTPCARWVNPSRPVMLRTREAGFLSPSDRVQVPHLLTHAGQPHLQLQAHGTSGGKLATGITFTTFSGMAVISGIALSGLGCSSDRPGMCTGGLITLGAGSLALAGSIYLILDSRARAQVIPHDGEPRAMVGRRAARRLTIGPGVVAGRF